MKSFFIKLSVFWLLILFSCEKYEKINPANWGRGNVMLNGRPLASFFSKGTVAIMGHERSDSCGQFMSIAFSVVSKGRPQNMLELTLVDVPKAAGSYQIGEHRSICKNPGIINAAASTIIDYDMSGNSYKLLPSSVNYLELTAHDPVTGEVKGTFQVTMVVDRKVNSSEIFAFPDILRYVGTAFHTRYEKK